jgi:NADH-quinone oxidoreductase subunit L
MLNLLWLVPALPLAGFLILALGGRSLPRRLVPYIGAGSVGLAAVVTLLVGASYLGTQPAGTGFTQVLWTWMQVGRFTPQIALYLDPLSLVMITVVTFVGFLIHVYSAEFMQHDEGYARFFAYMNLFVSSMLILLLGNNLLLLYLGWEGVGLCSFLLIGFWYHDPANGYAARKAFVVTRVGDTAMAIGLFLIFTQLGSLNIQELMVRAAQQWPVGSGMAVGAAALLLGGAVGKSAQLPLQTWLPDAMAGPTPVSALIHAATMVTAGVYLIARTHVLFSLAPSVMLAVAIIGALTLLIAGFSALTQVDIKRVLAYSTISQIGYMFLALGVGAWSAAIFHFWTHAFFKALLFLGAGVVIEMMHDEHDMFKMGGLRRQLPLTFWTFLIGASSLAALPLITAGFYSKDLILFQAYASSQGSTWLWAAGLAGALLTGLYTFRMVFVTFFGTAKMQATHRPGLRMQLPLVVLAVFSILAGFINLPENLGNFPAFTNFLQTVLPAAGDTRAGPESETVLAMVSAAAALAGIYLAYLFYMRIPRYTTALSETPSGSTVRRFWFSGWGFDGLYDRLFVRPYTWFAHADRHDVVDWIYKGIAALALVLYRFFSNTETGQIRRYAAGILVGALVVVAVVVFL